MKHYKFLRLKGKKIVSNSGNQAWKLGEWVKYAGTLNLCHTGLHSSPNVYQAFSYVQGEVLAEVEVKGKHVKEDDKWCSKEMRIVRAWKWQKPDSVALAIFSAELVLKNFEKVYPDDKRPRKAIEAARLILEHDTAKNRKAAYSAAYSAANSAAYSAAYSANSAASAASAYSAANSAANSAAYSAANSAAYSAAYSANSAYSAASAASAYSAANSAANSAKTNLIGKIDAWMMKHIKELEEII